MRRENGDDVILRPGKSGSPSKGWFPFGLGKGKRERDSLTVGPYQVGIIIWDGTVLDVFSEGTQTLPEGDVQTYIASTAPFNLAFRLKVPWEPFSPNDLVLDPPLVTADGQHVTGRIDLTLLVTAEGFGGTLVAPGDTDEGAHRLLQMLGLYGEVVTKSDVADMIKGELLPKLLALDLDRYMADELRHNRHILRDFAKSLETELTPTIKRYGLKLVDFYLNWDITAGPPQHHTGVNPTGPESDENGASGLTPLHEATRDGNTETVLKLVAAGADVHARSDGDITPLHLAAWNGDTETVQALVHAGADVHARSDGGNTPLHLAVAQGQTETAVALVSAGADIHARDDGDVTPLHLAAAEGQTETALALASASADLHAKIEGGFTSHDVTAMQGHPGTTQILTGERINVTSVSVVHEAQPPNFMVKRKKAVAKLAEYGFDCVQRQGTEFLAYHEDIDQPLTVHIKTRTGIYRKYVGKGVYICFPVHECWYLMPHDKLVEVVSERTGWLESRSWNERGEYHSANPSRYLLEGISEFVLE